MTNKKTHSYVRKATILFLFFTLVSAGILFSSFTHMNRMAGDVWKMLGISRHDGDEKIKNSFINGYLHYYGIKNLKNVSLGDRATIAKDLLTYTKDFVNGPAFIRHYEEMRKGAKPQEPELKPLRTIEEIQKDEIAKTEKSIRDTEKNIKDMPDLAKSLQPLLDMLKKNLKEYQDTKHSFFSSIAMGEKYNQEALVKSYNERMKQWEKNYPENVNAFVAERLQRMLNATADIDYGAELREDKYGKKKFVNSRYESKNQEWKQGFRAGKDVTEPARAFVQKWLSELQAKK